MIGGAGIQYKVDSMLVLSSRFSVLGTSRPARRAYQQPTTNNRQLPSRGFTLIEILVVVVILGILAAVVVPQVMRHPGEARIVAARQDIQAIVTSLNTYKLDNYTYPGTEQGLDALMSKPGGAQDAPNWMESIGMSDGAKSQQRGPG